MITEISSTSKRTGLPIPAGSPSVLSIVKDQPKPTLRLDEALQACRKASTSHEHATSWRIFTESMESVNFTTAFQYAREILLEFPYHASVYSPYMDRCLDACGTDVIISMCCSLLKDLGGSTTINEVKAMQSTTMISNLPTSQLPRTEILQACWSLLQRRILSKESWQCSLLPEIKATKNHHLQDRPIIKLLLTIPSLMANACHRCQMKLPLLATPTKFYPKLVECSACPHHHHHHHHHHPDDDVSYRIALIQGILATRNSAEAIARGLSRQHPLPITMMNVRWTGRELGHLILAFLQESLVVPDASSGGGASTVGSSISECDMLSNQHHVLLSCERLLKHASSECQSFVVNYLVVQTPMVVDTRLCPLFITILERCEIGMTSLVEIAQTWSEWSFCQDVSTHKQHFVSQLLLEGLKRLNECGQTVVVVVVDDDDALTMELLQGVTHRLESVVPQIRLDGMRIAQQVARRVNQELHFEELEQAEKEDATMVTETQPVVVLSSVAPDTHTVLKETKSKRKPKIVDPDAYFDSDDDEESNSTSDHDSDSSTVYDDELVPYSLDDDEADLMETPKPLHLLRALELLRTGENDEHAHSNHETALRTLSELVRKRPDDLPDVAISLVLQLIRMEDKFGVVDFLKLRQQSIVALCVMEPVVVGKQLTEEAFNEYPLSDRLTCFGALQQAAYELSGSMALDEPNSLEASASPLLENQKASDITTAAIDTTSTTHVARLQAKTRRKRSPRPTLAIIKNNFTPIAPMWFYSILGQFLKEKENEATWSGSTGSHLLSSMLRTLAVIVEFAGLASAPVLARDLIDVSASFLGADVAEVRMAVLIAVATSFSVLPDDRILAVLLERGDSLIRTVANLAQADPDHRCRALALTLSHSFADAGAQDRRLL